jgi:hypothetical protein
MSGYLEEAAFSYCEYPPDFYHGQQRQDVQLELTPAHEVHGAWSGQNDCNNHWQQYPLGTSPTARANPRRRGGKGKKDRQASSPASSYSGIQFQYAVSSSPPQVAAAAVSPGTAPAPAWRQSMSPHPPDCMSPQPSPQNGYAAPPHSPMNDPQLPKPDLFGQVCMLMAHGNLEERLREHENIPYED